MVGVGGQGEGGMGELREVEVVEVGEVGFAVAVGGAGLVAAGIPTAKVGGVEAAD